MFNEHEIASFLEYSDILDLVVENKKMFISTEARLLDISNHDFLSLIMMTPSVGIARANGNISLFEELALNKLARRMSKGGYYLKADPVAHAMKYLIKSYDKWELPFVEVIKLCISKTCDLNKIANTPHETRFDDPVKDFAQQLMGTPYGFVRFLTSFFLNDENNLVQQRDVSKVEYDRILDLSDKMELQQVLAFKAFLKTFNVR